MLRGASTAAPAALVGLLVTFAVTPLSAQQEAGFVAAVDSVVGDSIFFKGQGVFRVDMTTLLQDEQAKPVVDVKTGGKIQHEALREFLRPGDRAKVSIVKFGDVEIRTVQRVRRAQE
jgi:hypothetical protein